MAHAIITLLNREGFHDPSPLLRSAAVSYLRRATGDGRVTGDFVRIAPLSAADGGELRGAIGAEGEPGPDRAARRRRDAGAGEGRVDRASRPRAASRRAARRPA